MLDELRKVPDTVNVPDAVLKSEVAGAAPGVVLFAPETT